MNHMHSQSLSFIVEPSFFVFLSGKHRVFYVADIQKNSMMSFGTVSMFVISYRGLYFLLCFACVVFHQMCSYIVLVKERLYLFASFCDIT